MMMKRSDGTNFRKVDVGWMCDLGSSKKQRQSHRGGSLLSLPSCHTSGLRMVASIQGGE